MRSPPCIALAVSMCLASTTAFGHMRYPHRKRHPHRVHVQRRVTVVYVQPRVRKTHVRRQSVIVAATRDPAMVAASRDAKQAHLILKSTLPVYEGHRELALALCALANKEIKAGLKLPGTAPLADFSLQAPLNVHRQRKKAYAVYTAAQIEASDALLESAVPLIQDGLQALDRAAGEYGGYRSQAVNALSEALQEVRACLRLRG